MAPEQCGQLPHIFQEKIDFCPAGRTSKKAADFSIKVCRFFHAQSVRLLVIVFNVRPCSVSSYWTVTG
jgi:hypothetical protein